MPLAFRQWHLYRFDFMKTLWRLKPEEGDEEESMQNGLQKIFRTLQSMAKGGG